MFEDKSLKKILFFGPRGSYTEQAKEKFIEKYGLLTSETESMPTIISLLHKIDEYEDDNLLAVIPIENSIEGVVHETLDTLARLKDKNIKILSEVVIPISHCLITNAKSYDEIHTIASYPQGIAQCGEFIRANLKPDVKIRTANSTAQAVRELAESDSGVAAIASEIAASIYGFPILSKGINDEKDNKTRFILIGRGDTPRTGNDKTSITFSTENKPGALNRVLNILDSYNINMSYILSRPSKRILGEYTFYMDFDGHVKDMEIAKALFEILQHTKYFRHMGSYAKF